MSITAVSVFQNSHLRLTIWLRAIQQVTSQKSGISARQVISVFWDWKATNVCRALWMSMRSIGAEEPGLIGR